MFSKKRAVLLIVANSVGTGIFTTTGFALRDLQSPWLTLLVWCVGALYSFLGVYSYAALHRKFPGSGGEYHFLSLGIHRYLGVISGFVSMVAGFTAPLAAAAIGFSVYFLRAIPLPVSSQVVAFVVLTLIFLMHYFSLQRGMKWHDHFVFLKLGLFVLLLLAAFCVSEWRIPEFSMKFDALTFSGSFFWIAYAFSGWNAVYYVASELLSDEKTVNTASYHGTLLVSLLYILMNIPLLFGVDWQKLSGSTEVVAVFFEVNTGYSVERWVSGLIALGLLSTVSAFLVIAPRVYSRMAEDRVLPTFFLFKAGEHPRHVYLFQYLITLLCIALTSFEFILRYAGFALTVCSLFSVLALFIHREKNAPLSFYFLPTIYVLLTTLLVAYGGPWF
ncbi:MAG: amino acid permease [Bdellovibrionales bacterium]|nr:amino acid permease [Bdellovibrionales bacterium]